MKPLPGEFQQRKVTFGLMSLAVGCKVLRAASEDGMAGQQGMAHISQYSHPDLPLAQVGDFAGDPLKEERFRALQLCMKIQSLQDLRAESPLEHGATLEVQGRALGEGAPGGEKHMLGKIQAGKPHFPRVNMPRK